MASSRSGCSWGRTWLIVTGASRGFGAGICEEFAKHLDSGSVVLGFARNLKGLEDTGRKVQDANSDVKFVAANIDVTNCNAEMYEEKLANSYKDVREDFETVILVHNAGSLGALQYLREIDGAEEVNEYFQLNVSSLVPLTSIFLRLARGFDHIPKIYVVNISSLCAVSPFKSWGLYCSAKAARDMMFNVLALEEGENISVLNYSPGPLDNDMQVEVRERTQDPELKATFISMKKENKLIPVKDSVNKLFKALISDTYKPGEHLDYFDC